MIVDKDNPMQHLRWFKKAAVDEVKRDYNYLVKEDAEYFFDEQKTVKDKLLEIKALGSNDQYHLVCVSRGLAEIHIVDFMNWNDIPFDTEKYLS